jgi:hypothetical protein
MRTKRAPVSLTIHYRHPQRPDEAGIVLVGDQAKVLEVKSRLECRGFVITEIVTPTFAKPAQHQSD